jgi:hypothetical protein
MSYAGIWMSVWDWEMVAATLESVFVTNTRMHYKIVSENLKLFNKCTIFLLFIQ